MCESNTEQFVDLSEVFNFKDTEESYHKFEHQVIFLFFLFFLIFRENKKVDEFSWKGFEDLI